MNYMKLNFNKSGDGLSRGIKAEYVYPSTKWGLMLLNKAGKGQTGVHVMEKFLYCREFFIGRFRDYRKRKDFDTRKTRVLMVFKHQDASRKRADKANLEKNLKAGVKAANVIEKHYGWSLTKVYRASCMPEIWKTGSVQAYVVIGPPKWNHAPALLSLYLLILRSGGVAGWKKLKKFDNKNLYSAFSKLTTPARAPIGAGGGDHNFIRRTWKYWKPMLDNGDKIFFNRTIAANYTGARGFHGISKLVSGYGPKETRRLFEKHVHPI
jgi:hypothetical protein